MIGLAHSLYSAMWSNMWAPSVWTIASIAGHFVLSQRAHQRRHEDLKAHITASTGGRTGSGGEPQ